MWILEPLETHEKNIQVFWVVSCQAMPLQVYTSGTQKTSPLLPWPSWAGIYFLRTGKSCAAKTKEIFPGFGTLSNSKQTASLLLVERMETFALALEFIKMRQYLRYKLVQHFKLFIALARRLMAKNVLPIIRRTVFFLGLLNPCYCSPSVPKFFIGF